MNKGVVAALALLFLLVQSVHAADFTVDVKPVKDSIILGEQAAFDIRIVNNQDFKDTFRISYSDIFWDLISDPLYHYFSGVDISSGGSETVRLLLRPVGSLDYGLYKLELDVKAGKGKSSEAIPIYVEVRPEKPLIREYLAAVQKIVEISPVVDPRENVTVKVNLINRNPKNITDMKVVLSSALLNRETRTSLGPLGRRVVEEVFSLDPLTPPRKDVLSVKLFIDDALLEPELNEPYSIGSYSDIGIASSEVSRLFLKSVNSTTYVNRGNVKASRIIEVQTNFFKGYFTSAQPKPFSIERNGKRFLAWELSLEPAESASITRTVSYRRLIVLVLIGALVALLYYLFRSPVYAAKSASVFSLKEGGISEIKVIIRLKNRSGSAFERLTVTDHIPTIAEVSAGADIGTVKPASIYNDGRVTIVKWEIDKIEKGEERVLSYRMVSRLAILGSVTLPGVAVRFYSGKGTKLVTRSSKFVVKV